MQLKAAWSPPPPERVRAARRPHSRGPGRKPNSLMGTEWHGDLMVIFWVLNGDDMVRSNGGFIGID